MSVYELFFPLLHVVFVVFDLMCAALLSTPGLQGQYDVETAMLATPNDGHLFDDEEKFAQNTTGLQMGYYDSNVYYSPHQTFVCPSAADKDKQLAFYQENFDATVIRSVFSSNRINSHSNQTESLWRVFSLTYGSKLSKQGMDQLHQQWLCDINSRQELFGKYQGRYSEYPNFTGVLKHFPLYQSMSLFIHLKLDLDHFHLKDVDGRSTQDLMGSNGAILAILCNMSDQTSNDGKTTTKRRKMDIKLFGGRQLHSMEQARLGSMLLWCDEIIPHCVAKVNDHQKAEYPLYCGFNSHSVCDFII